MTAAATPETPGTLAVAYAALAAERQHLQDLLYAPDDEYDKDLLDEQRDELSDDAWRLLDKLAEALGFPVRELQVGDPATRKAAAQ